jgi:RNA polymerase sigma-70 factor (ECF subfamily)
MDEADFETFYRATADRLRAYLYRACDERRIVDDLLQEAYYRFLRSKFTGLGADAAEERTRYLFRIATNLLRDHWQAAKTSRAAPEDAGSSPPPAGDTAAARLDLHAALATLKAADREMLWLAYAEGYSHAEIAEVLAVKAASVRVLLFRARSRLVELLRPRGKLKDDLE